ncbi:hypothetical protein [Methanooceanicella nereidis]|uniref:hypothetical protein n=1 Tax=Methanooceanicella nereidis TaxID=2052831 RepID=UPI001E62BEAB|nr:hypothetical protein [Methanocella sp. CWC-04]
MAEKCFCGLDLSDFMRASPNKDLGFRKIVCAKCGKEFYTDIKEKTYCFDCESKP